MLSSIAAHSQVIELLASKDSKLATTAASILIHAAAPLLQSEGSEEQDGLAAKLKPLLLQLCSCGAPKAAKVAIRLNCGTLALLNTFLLPGRPFLLFALRVFGHYNFLFCSLMP